MKGSTDSGEVPSRIRPRILSVLALAVVAPVIIGSSAAADPEDVLSPELKKIIHRFRGDDLSRVDELDAMVAAIEDSDAQILNYLEKGIEIGDGDAVLSGVNALSRGPLQAKDHKRLREMVQNELNHLERLRDGRFLERRRIESDKEFRKRKVPFFCRESFIINAGNRFETADEDLLVQYLMVDNLGVIDHALNRLGALGTKASIDEIQEFIDREPFLTLSEQAAGIEENLKKSAEKVIERIHYREANPGADLNPFKNSAAAGEGS